MSEIILKECPKHGLTEHVLQKNGSLKCKECRKDAVIDIRRRNKIRLVKYKGGKCERCGYDKCIDALEFHHLNPNEKDFGLSCNSTVSLEKLKSEVDKCIMVCANCHREIHAEERIKKIEEREKAKLMNESEYFKNNDVSKRRMSNNTLKEKLNIETLLKDIKENVPKREMANRYGVSVKAIKNFLRKNGVTYDETEGINKTKNISIKDFIENFKKYGTFTDVAKIYGVSDNSIRKWCVRNNIPWRKKEIVEFVKNYKVGIS